MALSIELAVYGGTYKLVLEISATIMVFYHQLMDVFITILSKRAQIDFSMV
jgi:hypothetical protein